MLASIVLGHLLFNDGGLTLGGSPTLLSSHPTVSMTSEVVNLQVGKSKVTADCQFDFYNDGPACDVRMGFPDKGDGADDPYEETSQEEWPTAKLVSVFGSFKSWVDGKKVHCDIIKGKNVGEVYQSKTVHFRANSHVKVRDLYTVAIGGGVAADGDGGSKCTGYILHTGASWKGNIGRSTVNIKFEPGVLKPGSEVKYQADPHGNPIRFNSFKKPGSGIIARGPSKPTWKNNTLTFVKKDWRPTEDMNVFVSWGYRKFARGG